MPDPIIGFASRNQIREVLVSYAPDRIERYFSLGDFYPNEECQPRVQGEIRQLIEKYYANIDFEADDEIPRFFVVLQEILHDLNPIQCKYPWQHPSDVAEEHYDRLLRFLKRDGIELVNEELHRSKGTIRAPRLIGIPEANEAALRVYISQAQKRMNEGNYPAVLTLSYTMIEHLLKAILEEVQVPYKQSEGNIQTLYNALKGPLNLNPAGENIETYIRSILQSLQKQISALYDLANKAGDRHARIHEPAKHHAQLALNTSFMLCDYLLSSLQEQKNNQS